MNVLCIMPWYPANAPVFLAEAFARVGCHVTRIGPRYFDHMGLTWPASDLPTINLGLPREAEHWDLDEMVDTSTRMGYPPDLLYVSEENYQTGITPTSKVPVILWSQDGWPDNYARKELFQPTVAYCNQPRGNRYHPLEANVPGWKFMPGAAMPGVHGFLGLDRTDDFALYGTPYGKRIPIIGGLNRRGFGVLFGQRTTEHYVMGLNRSLATYHNPGHWEVKWRFFEAAACGCLNISARCKLLDGLGYLPYEHYMPVAAPEDETGDPWPSVEDLAAVIRELKSKPSLWRNIATRAREHTLRKHTYYHRCAQVAKDLDMKPLGKMTERAIDMMLVEEKLKWKSTLDLTGD